MILLLFGFSFAETPDEEPVWLYRDRPMDWITLETIEIQDDKLIFHVIMENTTEGNFKVTFFNMAVNGWDIIDNKLLDGTFDIGPACSKRATLEFSHGVSLAGISSPEEIRTLDYKVRIRLNNYDRGIWDEDTDMNHLDLVVSADGCVKDITTLPN